MTAVRLIARSHRFETLAVVAFAAAALGLAGGLALRLVAFGIPAVCWRGPDPLQVCLGRQFEMSQYMQIAADVGWFALAGIALLPVVAGLFLGVALVGKEIDRGTTAFAWSMTPSRRRWLMARVAPAAVFIVLSCLAAGALGDRLELLRDPQLNPVESYNHLGTRGAVVAGAGLAFFGFALLSGAVLGRLLPALLLAGALAVGSFVGVIVLTDTMLHDETVIVMGVDGGVPGRVIEYGVLSPAGERLTFHEAYIRYGDQVDALLSGETPWPTVLWVNPPEIYPLVVARMTVLFGALGLASIVLTFAVVDRRKP